MSMKMTFVLNQDLILINYLKHHCIIVNQFIGNGKLEEIKNGHAFSSL